MYTMKKLTFTPEIDKELAKAVYHPCPHGLMQVTLSDVCTLRRKNFKLPFLMHGYKEIYACIHVYKSLIHLTPQPFHSIHGEINYLILIKNRWGNWIEWRIFIVMFITIIHLQHYFSTMNPHPSCDVRVISEVLWLSV